MASGVKQRSVLGGVIGAVIGLVFGGAFLAAGLWVRATTQPLDDGVIVTARVVDVDVRQDSDGDTTYAPVVDYVDPATGVTHRLTGSVSTSSRPTIGSSEEVSLRPGDPSSARVVGPAWFHWIFIAVGGTIVVIVLSAVVKSLFGSSAAPASATEDPVGPASRSEDREHVWRMVDPVGSTRTPGFHPDPDEDGRLRYWDGDHWTDDFAPVIVED